MMKCPSCQAELLPGARFCQKCGDRLEDMGLTPEDLETGKGPRAMNPAQVRVSRNDPEQEVWQGRFSPKGMASSFAGAAVASLVLLAVWLSIRGALEPTQSKTLGTAVGLAVLGIWVYTATLMLYRRWSIHYRLTTQRLFHRTGILSQTTNRIEVLEMADITYRQGLIDRMLNVGTITVTSSDASDPVLVMRGIDRVADVAARMDEVRRKDQLRRGSIIREI